MTALGSEVAIDLRRATLADLRALDLRAPDRDLWADEDALWDRLTVTWAGLDDAAWRVPGAAPSDAGGPDWSLAEHVGHIAAWLELAIAYTTTAIETGRWPSDDDFDGGDFDKFNERLRQPWDTMPRDEILARLSTSRDGLLAVAHGLGPAQIRGDAAWGWVYLTLQGHYLDHLGVIEPWTEQLRRRQIDGDPFVEDPRAADFADFLAQAAPAKADFEAIIGAIPLADWDAMDVTPTWTLRDHVGHLGDWAEEGSRAIEVYQREGLWLSDPEEGIDAWNERMVLRSRHETPEATLARYHRSMLAFETAIGTLSLEELRSPDGWSWAYDCSYGHIRKHSAMLGPWSAAAAWPRSAD